MKRKNLENMFNLIDDDILEEASPIKPQKAITSKFRLLQIATIAACLILTLNIAITIPLLLMKGNDFNGGGKGGSLDKDENKQFEVIELPNLTDKENPSDKEDPTDKDEDDKVEKPQNVTNIQINVPGKPSNIITLTSPLLGAPSEYDKIVALMKDKIGSFGGSYGELDGALDEEIEDSSSNKNEQDSEYKETTDNQVAGVIEGDIIKRSGSYIYYLSDSTLKIYPMKGIGSTLLEQFSISDYISEIEKVLDIKIGKESKALRPIERPITPIFPDLTPDFDVMPDIDIIEPDFGEEIPNYSYVEEMFLSVDCKTVTIVVQHQIYMTRQDGSTYKGEIMVPYTSLISLSVEDPNNVYLKNITTLSGTYESARLVDGEFLVFTRFAPRTEELIIPQYNDGEGFKHIPIEQIYSPSVYKNSTYLLAFRMDEDTSEILDLGAIASFDGEIYVTNENIYVTRQYRDELKEEVEKYPLINSSGIIEGFGTKYNVYALTVTEILKIEYSSGRFLPVGTAKVNGYIKDRYSLSENDGYLYVVTTDQRVLTRTEYDEGDIGAEEDWVGFRNTTSASIFIVDIATMENVSCVERFAPVGETVRSVRFDGYTAYVCTAIEVTDPVFFFNLENVNNITYSDTGTIPGFSTQLIQLNNGELLGIGVDENGYVKIETYRLGENGAVLVVDTYLIKGNYSLDYKSHFINRENGLIGLGIKNDALSDSERYVMLQYKNGYFSLVFDCVLRGANESKRAVYDEKYGFFYLVSNNDFAVLLPIGKVQK